MIWISTCASGHHSNHKRNQGQFVDIRIQGSAYVKRMSITNCVRLRCLKPEYDFAEGKSMTSMQIRKIEGLDVRKSAYLGLTVLCRWSAYKLPGMSELCKQHAAGLKKSSSKLHTKC